MVGDEAPLENLLAHAVGVLPRVTLALTSAAALAEEDLETLRQVACDLIRDAGAHGGKLYQAVLAPLEKRIIEVVLLRCGGVRADAANLLGITSGALRHRMRVFGLELIDIARAGADRPLGPATAS